MTQRQSHSLISGLNVSVLVLEADLFNLPELALFSYDPLAKQCLNYLRRLIVLVVQSLDSHKLAVFVGVHDGLLMHQRFYLLHGNLFKHLVLIIKLLAQIVIFTCLELRWHFFERKCALSIFLSALLMRWLG